MEKYDFIYENDYLSDLISEFKLKVKKIEDTKMLISNNDNSMTLSIYFKNKKVNILLDDTFKMSSKFTSNSSEYKIIKGNELLNIAFMVTYMLTIDAVWIYNYNKFNLYDYLNNIINNDEEKTKKLLQDTDLTIENIKNEEFINIINKYKLLNNIVSIDALMYAKLKHLPLSITNNINDIDRYEILYYIAL